MNGKYPQADSHMIGIKINARITSESANYSTCETVCLLPSGSEQHAVWEYLGRNTSDSSLDRANRKKHTGINIGIEG